MEALLHLSAHNRRAWVRGSRWDEADGLKKQSLSPANIPPLLTTMTPLIVSFLAVKRAHI